MIQIHRNLQDTFVAVHWLDDSNSYRPARELFVSLPCLALLHHQMGREPLRRPLHLLVTLPLGRLHPRAPLRLHLRFLSRSPLSLSRRVLAILHPLRPMLFLVWHPMHRMLRTPRGLPLHPTMVGLRLLMRLHPCLRAKLPLVSIHRASSTLRPPASLTLPMQLHLCLARQKSLRGSFYAAESLAKCAIRRVADMHQRSHTTRISLHQMSFIVASRATGPIALRPTTPLHPLSPPTRLPTIHKIGILHQIQRGRGSHLPGLPAVGSGTRGSNSGLGTEGSLLALHCSAGGLRILNILPPCSPSSRLLILHYRLFLHLPQNRFREIAECMQCIFFFLHSCRSDQHFYLAALLSSSSIWDGGRVTCPCPSHLWGWEPRSFRLWCDRPSCFGLYCLALQVLRFGLGHPLCPAASSACGAGAFATCRDFAWLGLQVGHFGFEVPFIGSSCAP